VSAARATIIPPGIFDCRGEVPGTTILDDGVLHGGYTVLELACICVDNPGEYPLLAMSIPPDVLVEVLAERMRGE